jgi:hypothetical protein
VHGSGLKAQGIKTLNTKKRAEPQWFCSSGVIGLASLLSAHYAAVFKVRFGQLQSMVVN